VVRGEHRSLEALARDGELRAMRVVFGHDLAEARGLKLPTCRPAERRWGPHVAPVERRRAWRHAERLALTVASDAADGIEIERLLNLGRHELVDVDVASSHPAEDADQFGRISHQPYDPDNGYGIVTSRAPNRQHVRHPSKPSARLPLTASPRVVHLEVSQKN
jgi:hypothetical protein